MKTWKKILLFVGEKSIGGLIFGTFGGIGFLYALKYYWPFVAGN